MNPATVKAKKSVNPRKHKNGVSSRKEAVLERENEGRRRERDWKM